MMWPGVNGKGQVIISSNLSPRAGTSMKIDTQGKALPNKRSNMEWERGRKECGFYKEAIGNALYTYAATLKLLGFLWEEMIFGKGKEFSQKGMFIGESAERKTEGGGACSPLSIILCSSNTYK